MSITEKRMLRIISNTVPNAMHTSYLVESSTVFENKPHVCHKVICAPVTGTVLVFQFAPHFRQVHWGFYNLTVFRHRLHITETFGLVIKHFSWHRPKWSSSDLSLRGASKLTDGVTGSWKSVLSSLQ